MCLVYGSIDLMGRKIDCDGGVRIGDAEKKQLSCYFVCKFLVDRRGDESERAQYSRDPHRMKTSQ